MNEIEKAIQAVNDFNSHKIGQYGLAEHYDTILSAIEAQQAGRWIPVEQGLPTRRFNEQGEPVEHIVMIRRATEPTTLSIDGNGTWYEPMACYYNIPSLASYEFDVVAWRNMPEPYKEEQV